MQPSDPVPGAFQGAASLASGAFGGGSSFPLILNFVDGIRGWEAGLQVSDAGLAHLTGLTSLQTLSLAGTQVSDAGLGRLAGMTSLQKLLLDGTQVTDGGLTHLGGLTSLQRLSLGGTQVTAEGCDKLQQALPNCSIHPSR